jgi:RNA polymerase-binding transcription factor DksA
MIRSEFQKYREILHSMIEKLEQEEAHLRHKVMRVIEQDGMSEQEPYHSPEDERPELAQNEVALSVLGSEDTLLSECQAALQRMEEGKFGICEQCGHAIARKRLEAAPYARLCMRCAREGEPE